MAIPQKTETVLITVKRAHLGQLPSVLGQRFVRVDAFCVDDEYCVTLHFAKREDDPPPGCLTNSLVGEPLAIIKPLTKREEKKLRAMLKQGGFLD